MNYTKCSAKSKRTGEQCQARAMDNGKCYHHGGASLKGHESATFKTGAHSKYLPARLGAIYESIESDLEANILSRNIRLRETLIRQNLNLIEDAPDAAQAWDSLRKTMQRETGKWSYLAFVECHPKRSHIPHFHVLSLTAAPVVGSHRSQPLKDLAYRAGFGYIALEETVASWKAAWYVAKYASKHDPYIPRNFRRCRASRDWAKLPETAFPPYIVKSRSEHTWEYALRVADQTGVDPEQILFRYRTACNLYEVSYNDLDD